MSELKKEEADDRIEVDLEGVENDKRKESMLVFLHCGEVWRRRTVSGSWQ